MSSSKKPQKVKKSERRMAENEVVFRMLNEQIGKDFARIKKVSEAAGLKEGEYPEQDNTPLHFYCECFDEKCEERIIMKPEKYAEIHEERDRFIIIADHNAPEIEKIVHRDSSYWVVDKNFAIDQSKKDLQDTSKTANDSSDK